MKKSNGICCSLLKNFLQYLRPVKICVAEYQKTEKTGEKHSRTDLSRRSLPGAPVFIHRYDHCMTIFPSSQLLPGRERTRTDRQYSFPMYSDSNHRRYTYCLTIHIYIIYIFIYRGMSFEIKMNCSQTDYNYSCNKHI